MKDLTGQRFGKLLVLKQIENTYKCLCFCSCGNTKEVLKRSLISGHTKSCGCLKIGSNHYSWKGGKHIEKNGYVRIRILSKGRKKLIREHVYIMSQHLGRPLTKDEAVHHKNGIRSDNRIENLELRTIYHGFGQSVEDMIKSAREYLLKYKPEVLSEEGLKG